LLIAECSSGAHRVLISVIPAFGFRNPLDCLPRDGTGSVDDGLIVGVDVVAHSRHLKVGLDSQGPPERFSLHCKVETLRCRVQPSATPWQPEPRIRNDPGDVLAGVAPVRNNSQQCRPNITTTTTHTRSCHAVGWSLTNPSQPIDRYHSSA